MANGTRLKALLLFYKGYSDTITWFSLGAKIVIIIELPDDLVVGICKPVNIV
jgi:hypothetical protein